MRRRISLGDVAITGAIIGAAAALLLFHGLDIDYDEETGKWTVSQTKEVASFGGYKAASSKAEASAAEA